MHNTSLLPSLGYTIIRPIIEATIERKTAAHIMMLWKYKLLNQENALEP
jgi:hypothetical protein